MRSPDTVKTISRMYSGPGHCFACNAVLPETESHPRFGSKLLTDLAKSPAESRMKGAGIFSDSEAASFMPFSVTFDLDAVCALPRFCCKACYIKCTLGKKYDTHAP